MDKPEKRSSEAPAAMARRLIRSGDRAALGTLDTNGAPFVSLALTATDWAGAPILLLSRLAEHTRNLERDPRASLYFEEAMASGHALDRSRLSVTALAERLVPAAAAGVRERYLRRHRDAADYVEFADFSFWRLNPQRAHLVAGFAKIHAIAGEDLVVAEDATPLAVAEARLIKEIDGRLVVPGLAAGCHAVTGIDPEGVDLRKAGNTLRLVFGRVCRQPQEAIEACKNAGWLGN